MSASSSRMLFSSSTTRIFCPPCPRRSSAVRDSGLVLRGNAPDPGGPGRQRHRDGSPLPGSGLDARPSRDAPARCDRRSPRRVRFPSVKPPRNGWKYRLGLLSRSCRPLVSEVDLDHAVDRRSIRMLSVPPSVIALRAFVARFQNTCLDRLTSTSHTISGARRRSSYPVGPWNSRLLRKQLTESVMRARSPCARVRRARGRANVRKSRIAGRVAPIRGG